MILDTTILSIAYLYCFYCKNRKKNYFKLYVYLFYKKFAKDLKDKAEKQGISASLKDIADADPEQLLAAQVSDIQLCVILDDILIYV